MSDQPSTQPTWVDQTLKITVSRVARFTAYLGGVGALIAGYQTLVDQYHYENWQAILIAAIPIALTLLTDTFPAWREAKRKERIKKYAVEGTIPPPGYFRLTPYEAKDLSSYKRADGAHEQVLDWILHANQSILYLSGESGTGKSSLLNAYVIPKLNQHKPAYQIMEVRGYHDPVEVMIGQLATSELLKEEQLAIHMSPRELLAQAAMKLASGRLLIIFDQFEEFLILHDEEGRREFENLLASLASDPIPNLTVLLVFRSDYLPELNQINLPPLEQRKNWYQVGLFTLRASRTFLQESGLKVSEELIYSIAREAETVEGVRGLIRPITLNMYGVILERSLESLSKGMEPGALLRGYLEEVINHKNIQNESGLILRHMITEAGTKKPVSLLELEVITGLKHNFLQGFMVRLAPSGIVRSIDQVKNNIWEISHDFIAQLLFKILFKWKKPRIQKTLLWVGPIALVVWFVSVFSLLPAYSKYLHNQAIDDLQLYGFQTTIYRDGFQTKLIRRLDSIEFQRAAVELAKVRNLKSLDLTELGDDILDVNALSGLTSLKSLKLNGTAVEDVSALSGLINLESLDLSLTEVEDVSALSMLTNLETLYLSGPKISDIRPLSGLTNLKKLYLSGAKISDVRPLSSLTNLRTLDFSDTEVEDVSALSGLINLVWLELSGTAVKDVSALSGLTNLKTLDFSGTEVETVSALSGFINLVWLDLSGTAVKDVSALSYLINLKRLYLNVTALDDVSALSGLTNLETLYLSGTKISDIRPLSDLTSLWFLDLSGTAVKDVSALSNLSNLKTIQLSNKSVTGLDSLSNLEVRYID